MKLWNVKQACGGLALVFFFNNGCFIFPACYNIIDFRKCRICKLYTIIDNKACAGLELGSGPIPRFPKNSNLSNSRSNNTENNHPLWKNF